MLCFNYRTKRLTWYVHWSRARPIFMSILTRGSQETRWGRFRHGNSGCLQNVGLFDAFSNADLCAIISCVVTVKSVLQASTETNVFLTLSNKTWLSVAFVKLIFFAFELMQCFQYFTHLPTTGSKPPQYITSHPGQLSLAILLWVSAMSTNKSWEVNTWYSRVSMVLADVWPTAVEMEISTTCGQCDLWRHISYRGDIEK